MASKKENKSVSKSKTGSKAKASSEKKVKNIALPAYLDISQAEDFLGDIKKTVGKKPDFKILEIDASEVERITTPCVQILIALKKTLQKQNIELKINNFNDIFESSLDDLGFNQDLKIRESSNA